MSILKKILIIYCVVLIVACETMQRQAYYYNEIIVRNSTFGSIQDVKVRADKTGKVFRCTNIAPRASCSNSFGKKEYQGNPIDISWVYNDRLNVEKDIILKVPKSMDPLMPIQGVLEIKQDGSIATYFEQNVVTNIK